MKFFTYLRQSSAVEVNDSTTTSGRSQQQHLTLHTFSPLIEQTIAFPTTEAALNSIGVVRNEDTFTIVGLANEALPPKTITLIKILKLGGEAKGEGELPLKLFRVGKAYIGGYQQWVVWATDEIDARLQVGITEKIDTTLPPEEKGEFLTSLTVSEVGLSRGVLFTDIHRA